MKVTLNSLCLLLMCSLLLTSCDPREEATVAVESVKLSSSVLTLVKGDQATLDAEIQPLNVEDQPISWSVADEGIASVASGNVMAVSPGQTTITAQCGGKSATCLIRVLERHTPIETISFAAAELDVVLGSQTALVPELTPAQHTDRLEWSSSNEEVATVADGSVFARALGETTITVKSASKSASCLIRVKKPSAKVFGLSLKSSQMTMAVGDVLLLYPEIKADRPREVIVSWSSSDNDVVSVLNGRLTAKAKGNATITARAGEHEAQCQVEVIDKVIQVRNLSLDHQQLEMKAKQIKTLVVNIDPEEYLDLVEWRSDNEAVASVSPYGEVSARTPGQATITASVAGLEAQCLVDVQIALSAEDFTLSVDNIKALDAEITLTPPGDEITYIFDVIPKYLYDQIVARHGSIIEANRKFYKEFGEGAFLASLKSGKHTIKIRDLQSDAPMPGEEYIATCYGIDRQQRVTSPLVAKTFYLAPSQPSDLKLTFKQERITSSAIIGEVQASDPNISYYITLQRKKFVKYYMDRYNRNPEQLIDGVNYRDRMIYACISSEFNDRTLSQLLLKGNTKLDDGYFSPKKPSTDYVLIMVGYDMDKGLCTEPVFFEFRTEPRY